MMCRKLCRKMWSYCFDAARTPTERVRAALRLRCSAEVTAETHASPRAPGCAATAPIAAAGVDPRRTQA